MVRSEYRMQGYNSMDGVVSESCIVGHERMARRVMMQCDVSPLSYVGIFCRDAIRAPGTSARCAMPRVFFFSLSLCGVLTRGVDACATLFHNRDLTIHSATAMVPIPIPMQHAFCRVALPKVARSVVL